MDLRDALWGRLRERALRRRLVEDKTGSCFIACRTEEVGEARGDRGKHENTAALLRAQRARRRFLDADVMVRLVE